MLGVIEPSDFAISIISNDINTLKKQIHLKLILNSYNFLINKQEY